jgi:hypothetical protein
VLRWFAFTIVVLLSLGWKVAVSHDAYNNGLEKKEAEGQRKIAEFLFRQHFTAVSEKATTELPVIHATAGACQMRVIEASYDGSDRDRIRRSASSIDTVFVVFGGRTYADQPTLQTVSDYIWARFQRQLGLRAEATPVLFVIAKKSCEAERLPWHQLSDQKRASVGAAATGLWPRTGGASMLESKK